MSQFEGKTVLVVNTASKCGLTPQFQGLENLYRKYRAQGLFILGFPCNQFANQDPGNEKDIAEFCQVNYEVSFPMFAKVDVNGQDAHPMFKFLKKELPGLLGGKIKWNFTKFLIDAKGKPVKRFAPSTKPEKIDSYLQKHLFKKIQNNQMEFEQLKLSNQICFPVYAASRLIIRQYQPLLEALGITYPQYLVLMVLWDHGSQSVGDISRRLILNTNTLTPLLKRLEAQGLISRRRVAEDERMVMVTLTAEGEQLKHSAASIPETLAKGLMESDFEPAALLELKRLLEMLIDKMVKQQPEKE